MASVLMYFTNSTFPVERAVKNERPAFIKTRESSTPYSDDDIFRENVASLHDWVDDFGNRATRQLSELVIYRNDMFSSARKPTVTSVPAFEHDQYTQQWRLLFAGSPRVTVTFVNVWHPEDEIMFQRARKASEEFPGVLVRVQLVNKCEDIDEEDESEEQ